MKVLVACDEYAYEHKGNVYLREFGVSLIERYLDVFDEINFVVRTKKVLSKSELGLFNILVENSRVYIVKIPFFQGPKQYSKKYFSVQKKIKSSINRCDVAIFRIPSTVAFTCLEKWRKNDKPYAVETVANPYEISQNSQNIAVKFFTRINHLQQLKACKEADGASYVTEYSLQKRYPAKKEGHFESYYSSVELPDSLLISSKKYPKSKQFVLCHVANQIKTHTKGHSTVIRVVKELVDRGHDIIAKFAGEGEFISYFMDEAKKLNIENRIKFVGFLNKRGLKDFLISSDLMLFPSKSEGLPRVLIEAMAAGLPCLSTSVGGIPELLSDDLLYSDDDITGFVDKIEEIIANPSLYEELSETSFNKAKEYSTENLQARRIEFYKKLKELAESQ